jgi:hypothetical protein
MAQDPVVEALFLDYTQMRQELRDLINSMNTNLQVAILAVTATVGWGLAPQGDRRLLASVPTIIAAFTVIHLLKTASANVIGTYCHVLSARIQRRLGSDDILAWEGSALWTSMTQPTGIVVVGFYLIFLLVASLFVGFSLVAYGQAHWTAAVHLGEALIMILYAFGAMRWNIVKSRTYWLRHYGLVSSSDSDSTSQAVGKN